MSLSWFFALVFPFSSSYSLMELRKDFEQQERKQFYAMFAKIPLGQAGTHM